jgi:anti-sigma B factor antagonist
MTDSALTIAERVVGEVTVLTLTGQMVLDDGDLQFGRHIRDLIGRGRTRIVLDLGKLAYIDSSGVGMMVAKLKTVRESGGDIRLLHLTGRSQRLFGMLKLATAFERFDDEAAAVRSFTYRAGS